MTPPVNRPVFVSFAAGDSGVWKIDRIDAVAGEGLPAAASLEVAESAAFPTAAFGTWMLRGVTSNTRYATQAEVESLKSRQQGLGRAQSTRAALLPIRKSAAWWALAQDERRAIFEEQSHHNAVGMEYLPQIARRLHHSRELGEPFDFLTWFEYAPEDEAPFEELVRRLRSAPEWKYVEREVDIRLSRTR
jgi:chlorite dismutase